MENKIILTNESKLIKSKSSLDLEINETVELVVLTKSKLNINIKLNDNATLNITFISFNNKEIKFNVDLMNGSYLESNFIILNKDSKLNVIQNVNHLGRDSYSMVDNKAIGFTNSEINFNTTGEINKGIKNCNCNQLTRGLILQNDATIKAVPVLLIDEYDVKAYHGATIGNINEEDLFYLMSRGLTKNDAFNLVVNGLFMPFLEKIKEEKVYNEVKEAYQSFFI